MIFRRKKEVVKKPTPQEIKEHYEFFINNISKHMELAKQWLGKEKLDFSFEEIDAIGKYYKKLYKKRPRKKGQWYDKKYEVFVTYCGEAFIKYFLGKWVLNLDKKTFGYGEPSIMKYGPKDYHWISIDPADWLRLIEEGDKDSLNIYYTRKVNKFKNFPEWNFYPLENLEKSINEEEEEE